MSLLAYLSLLASASQAHANADVALEAPAAEQPEPTPEVVFRPFGFLRLEAAIISNDPNVAFVGRNDGFRLQNARAGIDATWRGRVALRVSGDGAIDERDAPNDVEGQLRLGLRDAYADLCIRRALTIRLARFKSTYDIEELTSTHEMTFIERALSARGTQATSGFETAGLGVRRNLGIALRSDDLVSGRGLRIGYELAAQNGNGEMNAANDNDSLAFSGSLRVRAGESNTLLVSGRYNSKTDGELPFRRTEDEYGAALALRHWGKRARITAQALYLRTTFPTIGGPHQNSYGLHAEALVPIPSASWLELGYRYALLEPSDLIPSDQVQEHTAGVNANWDAYRMRFQLNYTHTVEEIGRVLSNDRVQALVQVSL